MASEWAAAARLVRRTGFGATGSTVDAVVKEGAAHYVSRILAADPKSDPGAKQTPPPTFEPVAAMHKDMDPAAKKQRRKAQHGQDQKLVGWWLRRMLAVHQPFGEKATFAWHSHFATSLKKVKSPQLMFAQNDLLRRGGRGDFDTLANAMLVNGATLRWLDGEKNDTKGPNENLSREFMEIFTLGHADGYTEQDVREGARALTGWKINRRTGEVTLRAPLHDDKPKTLFGKSADLRRARLLHRGPRPARAPGVPRDADVAPVRLEQRPVAGHAGRSSWPPTATATTCTPCSRRCSPTTRSPRPRAPTSSGRWSG